MFKKIILLLKPVFCKIKFGNRFLISLNQRRWEKMKIILSKNAKLSIKERCNFRAFLQIRTLESGNLSIGKNVFINTNVSITCRNNIIIGDNVKIANNVVIIDHDHDYKNGNVGYLSAPVVIEDNVWIGANAVILKGVTIGKNAVVAAGSVVNKSIPAYCVAGGVPAKIIKENNKNEQ